MGKSFRLAGAPHVIELRFDRLCSGPEFDGYQAAVERSLG
jgi:hypothetical protein